MLLPLKFNFEKFQSIESLNTKNRANLTQNAHSGFFFLKFNFFKEKRNMSFKSLL